jgi:hypothetical protein
MFEPPFFTPRGSGFFPSPLSAMPKVHCTGKERAIRHARVSPYQSSYVYSHKSFLTLSSISVSLPTDYPWWHSTVMVQTTFLFSGILMASAQCQVFGRNLLVFGEILYIAVEKALDAYSAICISRRIQWVCLGRTGVEHNAKIGLGRVICLTPYCLYGICMLLAFALADKSDN